MNIIFVPYPPRKETNINRAPGVGQIRREITMNKKVFIAQYDEMSNVILHLRTPLNVKHFEMCRAILCEKVVMYVR